MVRTAHSRLIHKAYYPSMAFHSLMDTNLLLFLLLFLGSAQRHCMLSVSYMPCVFDGGAKKVTRRCACIFSGSTSDL
ncbi:hypothetical protein B0H65DRAFT_245656 [Neurospora tetraspora]|uniref:Uncharacterized protein n=1 Tax=Neurospora tetraspora TaxID=94610 RepID=A0AAE0MSD6_9PEZI|nr:hypothetical protein B0H65DRAFT_245656 [Neurospora tetraspora]